MAEPWARYEVVVHRPEPNGRRVLVFAGAVTARLTTTGTGIEIQMDLFDEQSERLRAALAGPVEVGWSRET